METCLEGEERLANRAYIVKRAVRSAMYRPNAGTSREIARRLLARQDHIMEMKFWLQFALRRVLRTCPPGDSEVDWAAARDLEGNIWASVLGEQVDEPLVEAVRRNIEQRLRDREETMAAMKEGASSSSRHNPCGPVSRPRRLPAEEPGLARPAVHRRHRPQPADGDDARLSLPADDLGTWEKFDVMEDLYHIVLVRLLRRRAVQVTPLWWVMTWPRTR
ncbi:unnamed protein product [Symbiodinium sp. CCMP2592]|nr:unnamed protein product [Symbiodinium sp. CCMP2592]